MIQVSFLAPNTNEWEAWRLECKRAEEKHIKAIEAGENSKVRRDVYRGKQHNIKYEVFMNSTGFFYGKCAYCESLIIADQPGDIEHFRPAQGVTDIENKPVIVESDKGSVEHVGYYWLAYDWRNMLPACRDCNSPSKTKTGGELIGKGNRFPVEGSHATKPGDEEGEEYLLIHPVKENPEKHLDVDKEGVLWAKNGSRKGQACIDVFGLNLREGLVDSREDAYDRAKNVTGLALLSAVCGYPDAQRRLGKFWDIWKGRVPYAAAGRAGIMEKLPQKAIDLLLRLYEELSDKE